MTADGSAGRLVRPFALTRGRTRPSRADFTLVSTVTAVDPRPENAPRPEPEHRRILRRCTRPVAVAELAALLDLPVGALLVLLCDLLDAGLITVRHPPPAAMDPEILRQLRDALGLL